MAGKLVFVTGGTGFLGHHMIPRLLDNGYRVRLFVRPTSDVSWAASLANIEFAQGDVTDRASVMRGMTGCEYVVHAAGKFRFWGDDIQFQHVNVEGSINVADAALRAKVRRFVHISTVAVVGSPPKGDVIDETTQCHPQDGYQRAKYAAEQEINSRVEHGLPAVILRPGAFYGPLGKYGFNRLFIQDPMRGVRVQVQGGKRLVFPVYVPDVAWAVNRVLSADSSCVGEIFNICGNPVSHADINKIVSDLLHINPWRLNTPEWLMIGLATLMEWQSMLTKNEPFFPLNLRNYVFKDWRVSSAKARKMFGFSPTPLVEGLKTTVAWYRKENTQ